MDSEKNTIHENGFDNGSLEICPTVPEREYTQRGSTEEGEDADSHNDDRKSIDDGDAMKIKLKYEEMEEIIINGDVDAVEDQTLKKPSNSYASKKTVAQGMMDIALITANANQLRYMVEYNKNSPTYYINLILISFSLILQVGIGVALIMKGRLDMKGRSKDFKAKRINNYVIIGVFMVTIINVFIASFTVTVSASKDSSSVQSTLSN
nr:ninjurin-2-like [Leptinotarsa decemlineata]